MNKTKEKVNKNTQGISPQPPQPIEEVQTDD